MGYVTIHLGNTTTNAGAEKEVQKIVQTTSEDETNTIFIHGANHNVTTVEQNAAFLKSMVEDCPSFFFDQLEYISISELDLTCCNALFELLLETREHNVSRLRLFNCSLSGEESSCTALGNLLKTGKIKALNLNSTHSNKNLSRFHLRNIITNATVVDHLEELDLRIGQPRQELFDDLGNFFHLNQGPRRFKFSTTRSSSSISQKDDIMELRFLGLAESLTGNEKLEVLEISFVDNEWTTELFRAFIHSVGTMPNLREVVLYSRLNLQLTEDADTMVLELIDRHNQGLRKVSLINMEFHDSKMPEKMRRPLLLNMAGRKMLRSSKQAVPDGMWAMILSRIKRLNAVNANDDFESSSGGSMDSSDDSSCALDMMFYLLRQKPELTSWHAPSSKRTGKGSLALIDGQETI